jgi:hypothetical protein
VSWNPTDAQLEDLKTGWTVDGLSAGQLSRMFGVTRNVVIGICHRRGWIQPGGSNHQVHRSARREPRPPAAPRPPPPPKKTEFVLDPEKFVVFDQLGPHHCRYPIDDGGKAGLYCGLVPNGTPYCEGHAAIVYQPQQTRKIKRPRS